MLACVTRSTHHISLKIDCSEETRSFWGNDVLWQLSLGLEISCHWL